MGVHPGRRARPRRDRRLGLGRLPRPRGPGARRPREDVVVRAPSRERDPAARQGVGRLLGLGPGLRIEARDDGYDEALLLDVDGFVAEGPGENLFIVKDGRLYEPAPTSALTGITRDAIITLARERGYEVRRAAD